MIPRYPFRAVADQEISRIIWDEKYRDKDADGTNGEGNLEETLTRIVLGVYENDPAHGNEALEVMREGYWIPGGRVSAGAGTKKRVTIANCFVNQNLPDSMVGIMDGLNVAAFTQQMGGGIGTYFGTLRPAGADVKKTRSVSSGVIPFMRMYDAMAQTIESSGSRRAAMMATLPCWHPDVRDFIRAKHAEGQLENFNVSVLISDAFIRAVREGEDWDLGFTVPRADHAHVAIYGDEYDGRFGPGAVGYVYDRIPARQLWKEILESTYEFSEPGVIFIDRVNALNPLNYCEEITCTNPCGELPLPPHGTCILGHANLAFMVREPFEPTATFDWDLLREVVRIGTRFLDNVLDVCQYPTEEFEREAKAKRRIGLGYTGLANALQQLRMRYGSRDAIAFTERVGMVVAEAAYAASVELARERGSFPEFKADEHLVGEFVQALPEEVRQGIAEHGLRNGCLLTIAPVGTGSLLLGNVSSGLEPSFAWSFDRKVRREGGEKELIPVEDFGFRLWKHCVPQGDANAFSDYMVRAAQLTVEEHVRTQAAAQAWVDASISKTVNCPEEMTFSEFERVYGLAYNLGLKGCATHRPNGVRGSILSEPAEEPVIEATLIDDSLAERPEHLQGHTYKVSWPLTKDTFYVTLNNASAPDGKCRPFEIFVIQKTAQHQEWLAALARTLSAVFRREFSHSGSVEFLVEELRSTFAAAGGAWVGGRFVPSIPALIGDVLERHLRETCEPDGGEEDPPVPNAALKAAAERYADALESGELEVRGETCPKCQQPTLVRREGCGGCDSCGWSLC